MKLGPGTTVKYCYNMLLLTNYPSALGSI